MEDYLTREIDKIAELLGAIASKLGLGSHTKPSNELATQLNSELADKLDIDILELLSMENPLSFLISERGFSDSSIELLTLMLYQTTPPSASLDLFIKNATKHLDSKGFISFSLHSITH